LTVCVRGLRWNFSQSFISKYTGELGFLGHQI
jgi:hypothetical protein